MEGEMPDVGRNWRQVQVASKHSAQPGDQSLHMTQDELDQQSIAQLHDVVLGFSKNCFELKKLCATVIGASLTLLAAFTADKIDPVFFVGSAVIIVFFLMADAQSYFYQEKVRIQMTVLQNGILQRNNLHLIFDGVGMPLSGNRQTRTIAKRAFFSVINWSMIFYYGLLVIDGLAFWTYSKGWVHSKP